MKKGNSKKTIIIGSILFTVIVGGMLFLVLARCDLNSIFSSIAKASKGDLCITIGLIACFIACEANNIGRVLRALGYTPSIAETLKYSSCGFFFSGITPSASGGQPMQLYFMHKDGIHLGHGSIALLADVVGFQVAGCTLAVVGVFWNYKLIVSFNLVIKLVMTAGLIVNLGALTLLLLILFSPKATSLFRKIIGKIVKKERFLKKVDIQIAEYRSSTVYLSKHKSILVYNTLVAYIELVAKYSIPFVVYLALGQSGCGWIDIVSLEAVLAVGVSAIPLPGTVGVGEAGFRLLFSGVFSAQMIMPAIIISRGIDLYLSLIITGLIVLISVIAKKIYERGCLCYNTRNEVQYENKN